MQHYGYPDCSQLSSRLLTLFQFSGKTRRVIHRRSLFSILTLIIFRNSQSAFYKVLMANAATSAFRLHQRLPRIQMTKEFLAHLLAEDSCHYLFFSLIYLYVSPVLLILFPVVLFAVLHSASYSLTLLDVSTSFLFINLYTLRYRKESFIMRVHSIVGNE